MHLRIARAALTTLERAGLPPLPPPAVLDADGVLHLLDRRCRFPAEPVEPAAAALERPGTQPDLAVCVRCGPAGRTGQLTRLARTVIRIEDALSTAERYQAHPSHHWGSTVAALPHLVWLRLQLDPTATAEFGPATENKAAGLHPDLAAFLRTKVLTWRPHLAAAIATYTARSRLAPLWADPGDAHWVLVPHLVARLGDAKNMDDRELDCLVRIAPLAVDPRGGAGWAQLPARALEHLNTGAWRPLGPARPGEGAPVARLAADLYARGTDAATALATARAALAPAAGDARPA